jgi:DNA-binding transcriptional ArsR family regulator
LKSGRNRTVQRSRARAPVFAALGDGTRLRLLARLSRGERFSISQLTEGTKLSRQAITKHLRILERVQMVHSIRCGRESVFQFNPAPIIEMKQYLDQVSAQWDEALARLKSFVED